ncbi:triacylglycerol lipase [Micromonospora pattaloongensis]|uniref:Triacylglycerol lipase n=1 Tax=Micromonospora pattaloongensis TaxID=405436 RepID=A0A1H3QQQ8_9ACTN|nr:alpha/beta fold hydrolase [Micromonospora pattaloongensis]SDZ15932.1 triacylglycerol lipase [Micromonospora pattaloongensis]
MRRILAILLATVTAVVVVPAVRAEAAARTPVIFVHGYTGSASNWTTARSVFRAGGYSDSELFAYEYNSYGDNVTNARGLASFVAQVRSRTGAAKVDIVNHSMGGMVSLWYVKQLGGAANVAHLASLAGANHGTYAASACLVFVTCQQMLPGSAFLLTLSAGDETPGATRYATWYSACDGVINPYTSTVLSGATNNNVACETHIGFLGNTSVLAAVRAFMAT